MKMDFFKLKDVISQNNFADESLHSSATGGQAVSDRGAIPPLLVPPLAMAIKDFKKICRVPQRVMILENGPACCSQLKGDLLAGRQQIRAVDGSLLKLDHHRAGVMRIGGAHIVDCDIMASNGVIHMVDAIVRQEDLVMRTGGHMDSFLIRL